MICDKWLHIYGNKLGTGVNCEWVDDVRENVRGEWIKLDMHAHLADHKCSACGQECYVPTCMGEPMYDFCPNCGADMRGERDDSV